jgi:hypothetical protein
MMTTPIERVAEVLVRAQYRHVPTPLEIAGLKIDVSDAFVGTGIAPDLIVVGDTTRDKPKRLLQMIEGIGRALDMMDSRRPLTLVVVGPRPDSAEISAMSRFARVLPVGELADDDHLLNWLAVLLPLKLPNPREEFSDVVENLLLESGDDPLIGALLAKADEGAEAVAAQFHVFVAEPFADTIEAGVDEEDDAESFAVAGFEIEGEAEAEPFADAAEPEIDRDAEA